MYLHVDRPHVREALVESHLPEYQRIPGEMEWHYTDLSAGSSPATLVEWTSSFSPTGVIGEAAKATEEKGRRVFDRAATRLLEMVRWLRARPAPPRRDHHAVAPTFALPFGW
jgi:creatinine amidohydrolase